MSRKASATADTVRSAFLEDPGEYVRLVGWAPGDLFVSALRQALNAVLPRRTRGVVVDDGTLECVDAALVVVLNGMSTSPELAGLLLLELTQKEYRGGVVVCGDQGRTLSGLDSEGVYVAAVEGIVPAVLHHLSPLQFPTRAATQERVHSLDPDILRRIAGAGGHHFVPRLLPLCESRAWIDRFKRFSGIAPDAFGQLEQLYGSAQEMETFDERVAAQQHEWMTAWRHFAQAVCRYCGSEALDGGDRSSH